MPSDSAVKARWDEGVQASLRTVQPRTGFGSQGAARSPLVCSEFEDSRRRARTAYRAALWAGVYSAPLLLAGEFNWHGVLVVWGVFFVVETTWRRSSTLTAV